MDTQRRKKRSAADRQARKGYAILAGFALSLCAFVFCAVKLAGTIRAYRDARGTYAGIAERFAAEVPVRPDAAVEPAGTDGAPDDAGTEESGTEVGDTEAETEADVTLPFRIDWEALREANPDVTGWLYSEGTPVHYPVVQDTDNEYYLTHDFYGGESAAGTLFLDARCGGPGEGGHLMIYGHRMKDDSMFGSVADYTEKSYYRKHPTLYYLTPDGCWRADVIGCRTVKTEGKYFPVSFESDRAYGAYLERIRSQRYYATDAEPDTAYPLLTLVTCSVYTNRGDVRLLVHCRLTPVTVRDAG